MSDIELPRLAEGVVDWGTVFDAPDSGLVSRIDQARSADDLRKAMKLILKTLFNREGDAERRAVFTNLVNEILAHAGKTQKSPAAIMAEVKIRVIQILHSIKDDRLMRARKALATKARKAALEGQQQGQAPIVEAPGFHDRQPDDAPIKIPASVSAAPEPEPELSSEDFPDTSTEAPDEDEAAEQETEIEPVDQEGDQEGDPEGDPMPEDFDEWLNNAPVSKAIAEYEDTGGGERKTPEDFFTDVVASVILGNMAAIRGTLADGSSPVGKLPFILSPAFAQRFEQILRDHVLPDFTESSYFNISQMSSKPRTKWLATMTDVFSDKTQGLMLWERWQIAWRNATVQHDAPPPPEVDPDKQGWRGFLKKLLGDDDQLIPDEEMTYEEWEELVIETRKGNQRAKDIWNLLRADSSDFLPPLDSDNTLLMSMFRSHEDLETHVKAFRRFAEDDERAGSDFDNYHQGKDLDLDLLSACYRYPDELISGEKTAIAMFVAGMDRKRTEAVLPLCCRFLGSVMGPRFSDH